MNANVNKFSLEKANSVFAQKLRNLFDESGKTQKSLSDYIHEVTGESITRQSVGQWCLGNTCPSLKTIPIIAEFFDVSTDYLLTDTDVRKANADVSAVCKYTGLSPKSVDTLSEFNAFSMFEHLANSEATKIASKAQTKKDIANSVKSSVNRLSELGIEFSPEFLTNKIVEIQKNGFIIETLPINIVNSLIEGTEFKEIIAIIMAFASKLKKNFNDEVKFANDEFLKGYSFESDIDFYLWEAQKGFTKLLESLLVSIKNEFEEQKNKKDGDPNAHHNSPQE